MCFSASASFTAGVLLTFVGVETIKKVHKPSQFALAGIIIFFAVQQFAEGILWTAMAHTGFEWLQTAATYTYLMLAQVVWPVIVPLSVWLLEENKIRKAILTALLVAGGLVALYNLYGLIMYHAYAEAISRHIVYKSDFKDPLKAAAVALYLSATLISIFVSSVKRIFIVGIIMVLSFAVSSVFYAKCLTSVWCFFAAVTSFAIFYLIRDSSNKIFVKHGAKGRKPVKRKGGGHGKKA